MDGIGWAAEAMSAARTRLDVAAGNLANGSSDGFRKSIVRGRLTQSGIEMKQMAIDDEGPLRRTDRPFDLAIVGPGSFRVRDARGKIAATRGGSFVRDRFGRLMDASGRVLIGRLGPVLVPDGAVIAEDGSIMRAGKRIGRIPLPRGASLRSGFIEGSNVDAIGEMIDVMTAQRSFEAAQKVLTAIDGTRERNATQVAALKG